MACEQWRGKIAAYADASLSGDDTRAFDAHVRSCVFCAAEALACLQAKRAVHAAGKRFAPNTQFRAKIAQRIAPRRKTAWFGVWMPRFALAAVGLLAIGVIGNRWFVSQRERTFSEIADLHVADLASSTPVDVASTDRHTVKPWFAGKLPFTFNLPEVAGTEFTLIGGRVAYLDQQPGVELLFQVRQHKISVFIFQERGRLRLSSVGSAVSKQLYFNVETWSEGGLRYFVITDASPQDVQHLSDLFKAAAR